MTNQQGAPEALRPIQRFNNIFGLMNPEARGLYVRYEDHVAALVEAQHPATHVQNPAEIEHVAGDVSKNGTESNMAQQPAPSAAVVGDNRVPEAWTNVLAYVLQDELHNRLTPRVIDIAYTAFMQAKRPNDEDGGASDWFNDTRPMVRELIAKLRKDLIEELAGAPQPSPAPQADSQPVPVVDGCTKQQMTAEVLRRMQQQEDGHNKNPFRSLLDRLMRNEGGYSTIEIGQLKYALDGFYGAARAPADSVTAPAYSIDADPQGIRARVADAITGALAFGAQGDASTDSGPISRQWLTVVYQNVEAGDEVRQICTHPKVSAMSWSHAIHDRDAARKQGANHD